MGGSWCGSYVFGCDLVLRRWPDVCIWRRSYRLLLRKEGLGAIRVGTVDDYQGQEEKIIVISTTLTNRERLTSDREHSLGFMANPKRFNVALTRAMALCVVVGNPYVMLAEPHWRSLLQYCVGELPVNTVSRDVLYLKSLHVVLIVLFKMLLCTVMCFFEPRI